MSFGQSLDPGDLMRAEVAATVVDTEDVDSELRHLLEHGGATWMVWEGEPLPEIVASLEGILGEDTMQQITDLLDQVLFEGHVLGGACGGDDDRQGVAPTLDPEPQTGSGPGIRQGLSVVEQRHALDQLHGVEERAVVGAPHVIDGDDIRVVKRRGSPSFVLKPLELPRVAQRRKGQHLERNAPLQRGLFCLVDHAHPAPADLVKEPEIAQGAMARTACFNSGSSRDLTLAAPGPPRIASSFITN